MSDRGDPGHTRERLYETLDSAGWALVLREQARTIRQWSLQLLETVDLEDAKRRGLVMARSELIRGIEACYAKAGRSMPPWFQQECSHYHDDE